MQITRATEYAVRCALHLAFEPPRRVVPRREIASAREIPEQFLGKIAQRMARAGIIRIHQGARGGYELVVPADRLTLLEVVEAAEGDLVLNTCVMNPRTCSRTCCCAAHRVWAEARRQLRATLAGVTFAELAAQEGHLPVLQTIYPEKSTEVKHELGEGVARRGGLQRRNEVSTIRKCQRSFPGTRSDRMPNETVSPQSKVFQEARERMVESMVVRSVRTPKPARVRKVPGTTNNKRR